MDLAYSYDLVNNTSSRAATPTPQPPSSTSDSTSTATDPPTPRPTQSKPRQNLQTEFQETFKAFSSSPWGAKLGGLWGNVRKQGESYYEEAVREAEAARIDAVKGFNDIREGIAGRVRSLSVGEKEALQTTDGLGQQPSGTQAKREAIPGEEPIPFANRSSTAPSNDDDTNDFLSKFKIEAAKRLKDVQAAEDAADQALLRFGTTIRSFLRDAVAVSAPEDSQQPGEMLFESKDSQGKRTIHTSRMDAQLHLIHTNPERLTHDPEESQEWEKWKQEFDVEKYTDRIAQDLETYPELRRVMGELVPEKVQYGEFWGRYYFLRGVVEEGEKRRRELLRGMSLPTSIFMLSLMNVCLFFGCGAEIVGERLRKTDIEQRQRTTQKKSHGTKTPTMTPQIQPTKFPPLPQHQPQRLKQHPSL